MSAHFRRNKRSVNNCPICGVFVCEGYQIGAKRISQEAHNHECDPEFLERSARAQDAAMSRDADDEPRRGRTEADRLAEGFEMLQEDDPLDDEEN